jgi:type II secretory pathway pseudopilin PulG
VDWGRCRKTNLIAQSDGDLSSGSSFDSERRQAFRLLRQSALAFAQLNHYKLQLTMFRAPFPFLIIRRRDFLAMTQSFNQSPSKRHEAAFSLVELLVVISIMIVVAALIAPAFTSLKGAGDVTSAAYTIEGVLDQARTYAMANNTYTWVGFYEEDASQSSTNPPTAGVGRLVMSIVASKDGTTVYNPNSTVNPDPIDPTKLAQLGKLLRIENVHLPLFAIGAGTGTSFDTRPTLQNDPVVGYNDSRFGELNGSSPNTAPATNNGNSKFPFQYPVSNPAPAAQYTFRKTLQFDPRGEGRINSTYDVRRVIEIGLMPTRGNVAPTPTPSAGNYPGNIVAVQLNGFAGNVKVYRR